MGVSGLCSTQAGPCVKEPKIFNLYLESVESGYPCIAITVSEYQLIEAIRVLSCVYRIRITD